MDAAPAASVAWENATDEINFNGMDAYRKFWYRGGSQESSRRAGDEMWSSVRPIVERHVNGRGSAGWQLTVPLTPDIVQTDRGESYAWFIWLLLGLVSFGIGWLVAAYLFVFGNDQWVRPARATLPFRRMVGA